jgi:hypothetical protein
MILVTRQFLVSKVVSRWRDNYYRPMGWYDDNKREIYEQLIALESPTAEDVNHVIGNGSWTSLVCDSCKQQVDEVVSIDVTGGEYATYICEACLNKAQGLFGVGEIPF